MNEAKYLSYRQQHAPVRLDYKSTVIFTVLAQLYFEPGNNFNVLFFVALSTEVLKVS